MRANRPDLSDLPENKSWPFAVAHRRRNRRSGALRQDSSCVGEPGWEIIPKLAPLPVRSRGSTSNGKGLLLCHGPRTRPAQGAAFANIERGMLAAKLEYP